MSLKDDKQQNIQFELDFSSEPTGEAREAGGEGTESSRAMNGTENPASANRLMEAVCERENLKAALRQVKANKGSPGVDGMTVVGLKDYLKQHWPAIWEQLLNGTYEPKAGEAGGNPQAGRRGAKAWHPHGAGSIYPTGGDAGSAEALGPDVFRSQLWVPAGTVGSSSGGTGTAVYRRRPRLVR